MRALSLVVVAVLVAAPARAGADDAIVVLERADGDDDALVDRVEGQVSDLAVALVREPGELGGGAGGAELDGARAIAARHGARAVIWFRRDGDGWLVHVAEPDADRVVVRRVAATGDLAGSATAEAVALVVRAAVRAILVGEPEPEPEPEPAPPPPPVVDAAPPPASPPPRRSRAPRPFASLGWRAIAGDADAIHHAASARAGAARGRWSVAVDVALAPPITLADPSATIDLGRRTLAVTGGRALAAGGGWRLAAELGAGAHRFDRSTSATGAGLSPTAPAATWVPVVAPGLRASRRLGAGAWLELAVGADVLPRVPEFGVPAGDGFVVHTRLLPVQPTAALAVTIEGP